MNTGPEIDMSRLEESETETSIRDETRALLQEAKAIMEMAKGTEKEEDFSREYGELADEFNSRLEDEVIDNTDLNALKNQLDEVRLARDVEWRERKFLDRISSTNERIINGGESELIQELNEYRDQLTRFGIGLALSNEQQEMFLSILDDIESDSSNHILNRLLNLTHFIKQLTTALDQTNIGSFAMNTFYTGDFNETHDYSTREIVREALKISDGNTFVSYDKIGTKGYEVKTGIPDTSNSMEVGTYLCSLNKSGNLNKENLLEPNGPFSPTELFQLIENYKAGEFGGPEVQGLFTGYLAGFEDNMNALIKEVLETESNPDELLHIIDSTNSSPDFIGPILPIDFHDRTYHINIDGLENPTAKNALMSERSTEFTDTALAYQENMLTSFGDIYGESPEIMLFLERSLSINGIDQNDFDIDAIETLITEHNNSHPERPLPSLQTSELSNILNAVSALREVNLAIKFDQSMSQIIQLQEEMNNIHIELEASRQALIIAQEEGNQEAIDAARNESIIQQRASYGAARAAADATRRVNEANNEAAEEIQDAISTGNTQALQDIQEEHGLSEEKMREYKNIFNSFIDTSINININNPIHRDYILEKPKERLILLNNAEDLAYMLSEDIYPDVERALEARNEELKVNDINPSFLNHPQVLDFFVRQDIHRDNTIGFLPGSIFRSQELTQIVFKGGEFLWGRLFENIYGSNTREESIEMIRSLIASHTETYTEREREYLEKAIHRDIYEEVLGKSFEENAGMIDDDNDFGAHIDLILDQFQNPIIPAGEIISPIARGASMDGFVPQDEYSVGFNEQEVMETLLQYIRVHGLSDEILVHLRRLVDARGPNDLSRRVLGMLQGNEASHLDYAQYILFSETKPEMKVYLYSRFNAGMKENEGIIQEMGRGGIESFQPILIQSITNKKIFAQYLIGYIDEGHDMRSLRLNSNMNFLQGKIETEDTNDTELSRKEVEALDAFFERNKQIRDTVENIEGDREIINENHRSAIIKILSEAGLSNILLGDPNIEGSNSILPKNMENRQELDEFLVRAGEELDKILEGDETQRNVEIRRIIELILTANESAQEERVGLSEGEWEYSPQVLNLLRERGFTSKEGNETVNIDFDGITGDYLESYRNENPSTNGLDDKNEIRSYLISLGIPQDEMDSIVNIIVEKVRLEIDRRARETYESAPPGTPWNSGLENPPGLYGGAENSILESISTGKYEYGGAPLQNDAPETTPQETSENSNPPESINYSAYELSGTAEAPTLSDGETTIPITPEEAGMIANNPKAKENLINMYDFFKELNLLGIWEYREELVTALGNRDINLDDDSLAEDELLLFGNQILNIIQNIQKEQAEEDPNSTIIINTNVSSIESLNMELAKFSGSRDLWGDDRSFNTYGDDRFESWMRNNGIIGGITFHTNKIREMM